MVASYYGICKWRRQIDKFGKKKIEKTGTNKHTNIYVANNPECNSDLG